MLKAFQIPYLGGKERGGGLFLLAGKKGNILKGAMRRAKTPDRVTDEVSWKICHLISRIFTKQLRIVF